MKKYIMRLFLKIVSIVLLTTFGAYSQTGIIVKGRVVNKLTNKPVAYASVFVKTYSTGTYTNEQGLFMLKLPQSALNDTVAISCIGYESLRMKLSELKSSKIRLSPKINMLDEIAIVASYQPRKILKKVYKKRRKNYPYSNPYCAETYYREYTQKNDTTLHMLEMTLYLKEKKINSNAFMDNEYQVDTINYFYRSTDEYIWGNFMLGGPLFYDGLERAERGTYIVDSVFFKNKEKYIAISFIHKKSDSITFYKYTSIFMNDEKNEIEDEVKIKAEESYQYMWKNHFIINMTDYAIVDYSMSYYLLGKPMRFELKINKRYNLIHKTHVHYKKIGTKYYPVNYSDFEKKVFVKKDNIDVKDYTLTLYSDLVFNKVYPVCQREITDKYEMIGVRFQRFKKRYRDKIYQQPKKEIFSDEMKKYFLQTIYSKNILEETSKK